jgi:exodeoxyribonuclease VII large subunit
VLDNARRRWPNVAFEVAHATMQGPRAAAEVMEALGRRERHPEVDVIVVARGGGSVEDLLPFSDEALVRAVHQLRTPVVSAIGHEQDQPLLDLVADVRASTPTDAAKLVVPDVSEELRLVEAARHRVRQVLGGWLSREQAGLDALRSRPVLGDPRGLLDERGAEVRELRDRARRTLRHRLERAEDDVAHQRARARALSPLATLERGYAVLQDADGHVVTSVAGLAPSTPISVRVADGRVHATTTRTELLEETDG